MSVPLSKRELPCRQSDDRVILNELHAKFALSEFRGLAREILLNHKRNLEGNGMVELAEVKAGELANFLKSVYKCVTVNEKLSRCFRNVEVILKEALNRH